MALQEELEVQGQWLFRYRGGLPLVILVIGAYMYCKMKLEPGMSLIETRPYEISFENFCLFIGLIGLAIRIYTVGHTPINTSGRNVKEQLADELNTTGIYSLVRHPLYVGNFLMWLAPAMLTANVWFIAAFCLFYWVYYERIMYAEEQFLRRKFKEKYTSWSADVPAFLPRFSGFKEPKYPFSWRKVLKKEKNGLAALFLIFFAFDYAGEWLENGRNYNYLFMVGAAVSLVLYLVLKVLKKYTRVLHEEGR